MESGRQWSCTDFAMKRRRFLTTASLATITTRTRAAGSNARLRVAVIGHTGRGNYGHGIDSMWLDLPETVIVAVADADEGGLNTAKKKLKVENGYSDYHAMLQKEQPDIVAVGPRHLDQHRDMIVAAIEAGAKGVYCEKPFCRSLQEADEIVAAADAKNVKVALAHRNVYHPVLPNLKIMLADGLIGRVLELRLRGKEDRRGGSEDLWVLGTHLFNLAHYLEGPPLTCSATVLKDGKPVTRADVIDGPEGIGPLAGNEVHARFEMESGRPVFFDSIHNAGTKEAGFGAQIIGTGGIIDLRIDKEPLVHLLKGSPFSPANQPGQWLPLTTGGIAVREPIENLGHDVAHHLTQGRDLIAAIREDRAPLCDARAARITVEMVSAVFESHRKGGSLVSLPLETRVNPLTLL